MNPAVQEWLALVGLENNATAYLLLVLSLILLTALVVHFVLHHLVFRVLSRKREGNAALWQRALVEQKLFTRLAFTLQGIIFYIQTRIWMAPEGILQPVLQLLTLEWILLYSLLSLYSLLNTLEFSLALTRVGRNLPLRGLSQSLKLLAAGIALILAVALLIGKSPVILFSGLGAMTAVLLLVFKDPLLGLVAGIQLSANNMLRVGDWLEMPKYGADGDVIDISLTTVKVRNWDKTITTVPSYALIADSFKNWRGMEESGGRRIKRAFSIDMTSVRFLDDADVKRLRRLQLLSDYMESKIREIDEDNKAKGVSPDSPANGRRLTNLGTFRAYLTAYLKRHEKLNQQLTTMVRQLQPGPTGMPLEVYCFTSTTDWVPYESIQADIFDHILAVIPEFDLRLHQSPTGHDMHFLSEGLATGSRATAVEATAGAD